MSNFKLATRSKLRFQTSRGILSTEQLWDLSISELDALAVSLEEAVEKSGRKSFVVKTTEKSKKSKLQFDIVLEILNTLMEEQDIATQASKVKRNNDKILALIARKKETELESMSVEDLEKLLK